MKYILPLFLPLKSNKNIKNESKKQTQASIRDYGCHIGNERDKF